MRKNIVISMLSVAFLFAALIICGYNTDVKASEYQTLESSWWHQSFVGNLTDDKGVSRPVNIKVVSFLSGGELANIVFVDKGRTYYAIGAFINKHTMEARLSYGAKIICKRRSNGSASVSIANAGGLMPADGTIHSEAKSSS